MTNQERIEHLQSRIASLAELLPYADGQAYYDDKRKIAELSAEMRALEIAAQQAAPLPLIT